MEADWEVEIAADVPVIDADWPGFADLRTNPEAVTTLPEVQQFPALGRVLLRLNGSASDQFLGKPALFLTAKCDLWTPESIDPDEMEASLTESVIARACYIDLIPEDDTLFASLPELESKTRQLVSRLRTASLGCSRIDLVLRQAISGGRHGFGITAYTTVCGPNTSNAEQNLDAALNALVDAICPAKPPQPRAGDTIANVEPRASSSIG